MSLFDVQKMNIYQDSQGVDPVTKEFSNKYTKIADDIPCRITGTHADDIILFVSRKNYELIPGGIKKEYKIKVEGVDQVYRLTRNPIWAAGKPQHHYQFKLTETN
jgi:hypothetical protein